MCSFNECCCICTSKSDLKHMFVVDNEGLSHYEKLTSSIIEMNFREMTNERLICRECCIKLNTAYHFRQMCLRSKTNLMKGIAEVKKEVEIKCEKEDSSFEDHNPQPESSDERISAPVNEQYDVPSFSFFNVNHVNESAVSNVKVENDEDQTMEEDEQPAEFSEIDIEEHPLDHLKEEPVSDIDHTTPQDGSTNQTTSGEQREREQITTLESILRIHSGEKLYICEVCKKSFVQHSDFTVHMQIHSREKPFKCEICGLSFAFKKYLSRHMPLHSSERPYKCEKCDKRFTLKFHLDHHMRLHFAEAPYECKVCKKCFINKTFFTEHMRVHSEERPHQCEICPKAFKLKSHLTRHIRIHTGENPYKCELCSKSFRDKNKLNRHFRIHTKEKPFECKICKGTLK